LGTCFLSEEEDTSFMEEQDDTSFLLEDDKVAGAELQAAQDEGKESPFGPGWTNTEGIPIVAQSTRNDKYYSPDMANSAGESNMKPIFGCKCGDWQPAATHPSITFQEDYIKKNPDFIRNIQKLKVHMEDTTVNKLHWDAVYDVKKFMTPADIARSMAPGGNITLTDTMPADKGTGQQIRFMTFCPPEGPGSPPHEYLLKVTALDATDTPIPGFIDEESRYNATPSDVATGPVVGTVKFPGTPLTTTS
jgi:hypothetical protein